eukprot:Sspe_Gene.43398::Locus_21152_Transcript_1_1_Confidence_1.000_Length_2665::g.43398::m.43398
MAFPQYKLPRAWTTVQATSLWNIGTDTNTVVSSSGHEEDDNPLGRRASFAVSTHPNMLNRNVSRNTGCLLPEEATDEQAVGRGLARFRCAVDKQIMTQKVAKVFDTTTHTVRTARIARPLGRMLPVQLVIKKLLFVMAWVDVMTIPFRLVFKPSPSPGYAALDIAIDVLYAVYIAVNFVTPFYNHGLLVDKLRPIAIRYVTRWEFILDIISAVPTGTLAWLVFGGSQYVRINKLLFAPIYSAVFLNRGSWVCEPSAAVIRNRLLAMALPWFLLVHAGACTWHLLVLSTPENAAPLCRCRVEGQSALHNWLLGVDWMVKHMVGYGTTCSFPVTDSQTVFMLVVAILGVILYAKFLATVAAIIVEVAGCNPRARLLRKLDETTDVLSILNLPRSFQEEVRHYYLYVFKMASTIGASTILEDLPDSLRERVNFEVSKAVVARLPLFEGIDDPEIVEDICACLIPKVFLPGITLVSPGSKREEMFFVLSGQLREVAPDGKLIRILGPGDRYGDTALIQRQVRQTRIETVSTCTIFVLSKEGFLECIKLHPTLIPHIVEKRKSAAWMKYYLENNFDEDSCSMVAPRSSEGNRLREYDYPHNSFSERGSDASSSDSGLLASTGSNPFSVGSFLFQQGDESTQRARSMVEDPGSPSRKRTMVRSPTRIEKSFRRSRIASPRSPDKPSVEDLLDISEDQPQHLVASPRHAPPQRNTPSLSAFPPRSPRFNRSFPRSPRSPLASFRPPPSPLSFKASDVKQSSGGTAPTGAADAEASCKSSAPATPTKEAPPQYPGVASRGSGEVVSPSDPLCTESKQPRFITQRDHRDSEHTDRTSSSSVPSPPSPS